jgi:hypothetical protein
MYLVMNEITKLISRMCHEQWLLVSSAVASCVRKTTFSGSDRKLNLSLAQSRSKFQSTGVPVTGSKIVHKVTLERHRICALWPELLLLFITLRIWVDCVRYHVTILRQQGITFLFVWGSSCITIFHRTMMNKQQWRPSWPGASSDSIRLLQPNFGGKSIRGGVGSKMGGRDVGPLVLFL